MSKGRNDFVDALLTGFAMYGIYKAITHPGAKRAVEAVKKKCQKEAKSTVRYVSEEEADLNANVKNAFVDVTAPDDEAPSEENEC